MVYGAITGDIVGSRFEFDRPGWTKDFELFTEECNFTDDTVMTLAIARALEILGDNFDEEGGKEVFTKMMQMYGQAFPSAGYGANFYHWIFSNDPMPYDSCGNGSAMRVSAVGWVSEDLAKTKKIAKWTAEISHNHPEGIKGAECTAAVIWLARHGVSKKDIEIYVINEFGYDLSKTVEDLIPLHKHNETCQDTMPKALIAFLDGESFEDVIRNAVALGGDTDTIAAIAGSMAEAMYGIPTDIKLQLSKYLPQFLQYLVVDVEKNRRN